MIEKALNLFERFVVAVEKIAADSTNPMGLLGPAELGTVAPDPCSCPDPCAGKTEVDGSTAPEELTPGYGAMDLAELKAECKKRGIEVPPRTRAKTMAQWLEDFDLNTDQTAQKEAELDKTPVQPEPETSPDPGTSEPAEDPFADPNNLSGPTIEETRIVLRELLPVCGSEGVIALIKEHAGVDRIAMVPPSKFPAIIAGAKALMPGEG